MDLSATGYLLLIPGLILTASPLFPSRWLKNIFGSYTILMGSFLCLITTLDLELFRHWGYRFDISPLKYIGKDTLSSTTWTTDVFLILVFAAVTTATVLLYRKLVNPSFQQIKNNNWFHAPIFLLATAFLILPIRGSLDIGPMNTGTVFFHKKNPFANQSAINLFWNFGDSVTKSLEVESYPENFLNKDLTSTSFQSLYDSIATESVQIIKEKPNVLLIL